MYNLESGERRLGVSQAPLGSPSSSSMSKLEDISRRSLRESLASTDSTKPSFTNLVKFWTRLVVGCWILPDNSSTESGW